MRAIPFHVWRSFVPLLRPLELETRSQFHATISRVGPRLVALRYSQHTFHNPGAGERLDKLHEAGKNVYPRIGLEAGIMSCAQFKTAFQACNLKDRGGDSNGLCLQGRVSAVRRAGSKLVFIDIIQDGHLVQTLCNFRKLGARNITVADFRKSLQSIHRGDHIRLQGHPSRTESGELTLALTSLPETLSPCLPDLPTKLEDPETRMRLRHLDLLVNRSVFSMIRLKGEVIQYIRQFLLSNDYLEVQTPILAQSSGGAVARSFETRATEFPEKNISLRIAPELWLKRLIIGGFDKIFEIGPSFRNEGIDLTHNPEFTSCEFYQAYASLENLIQMTELMLSGLDKHLKNSTLANSTIGSMPATSFDVPFKRIDFVSQIEKALAHSLPDLQLPNAREKLIGILKARGIEFPDHSSLPQLLDKLSNIFIEPLCIEPTFIVHHPECLSPLAKSFRHDTGQIVAARAELFVNGREIINTYEEENSPVEQRRKFEEQARFNTSQNESSLHESYIEALEWGLPPTGGWGGGIERLCMALTGASRIGDVLSFGTLRNVVALAQGGIPRH